MYHSVLIVCARVQLNAVVICSWYNSMCSDTESDVALLVVVTVSYRNTEPSYS